MIYFFWISNIINRKTSIQQTEELHLLETRTAENNYSRNKEKMIRKSITISRERLQVHKTNIGIPASNLNNKAPNTLQI